MPKNWCFWTVVLEKTLESPLDCKGIQPVHSEGDQPWDFFERNDAKAETPILWPLHAKSWLIGKDPDAGRDWGQEEKGMTEDEMAEWHHRLDGHEFGWTPGVGDGQGGLACCNSWSHKESDMTERLNWTELHCTELLRLQRCRHVSKTILCQNYEHLTTVLVNFKQRYILPKSTQLPCLYYLSKIWGINVQYQVNLAFFNVNLNCKSKTLN